jgi:hypothetical protein
MPYIYFPMEKHSHVRMYGALRTVPGQPGRCPNRCMGDLLCQYGVLPAGRCLHGKALVFTGILHSNWAETGRLSLAVMSPVNIMETYRT